MSYLPCGCAAGDPPAGHRVYFCQACGRELFDPPHNRGESPSTGRWQ